MTTRRRLLSPAMRRILSFLSVVVAVVAPSPALADEVEPAGPAVALDVFDVPERIPIEIPIAATYRAPSKAALEASVRLREGQTSIDLSFGQMAPAILFGGDITSFVVWAVTPEGQAENLGELRVREESGSVSLRSGQKSFSLMVTAEPNPFVTIPSELVIFTTQRSAHAQGPTVRFSRFRTGVNRNFESIAGLRYGERTPAELQQAAKVLAQAEAVAAGGPDADKVREARINLAQATNSAGNGSSRASLDLAQRAIARAGEVIRDVERRAAEKAAAQTAAKKKSDLDALAEKLSAAEEARATTAQALSDAEQGKAALAAETERLALENVRLVREQARLEAEQGKLKAGRDLIESRLRAGLSGLGEVSSSGRALTLSLPSEALFHANKTTLRTEAKVTLAKLAGILLVFMDIDVRAGVYTDSLGAEAANVKLSKRRALAVVEFLKAEGIAGERMKSEGYGPANPVAPNDTLAGRTKNRRVEIVLEPSLGR